MKPAKLKEMIEKVIVEAFREQEMKTTTHLSHDVELFLKKRQKVSESIETGGYPDFWDPEKKSDIENEIDVVENLLPDLGATEQRYLELITSESYKKALDKAAHYLGTTIDQLTTKYPNVESCIALMMGTHHQVMALEQNHRQEFEKMTVDVVLNLPENKLIKDLVLKKKILLDVKLGKADLSHGLSNEDMNKPMNEEMTYGEALNVQLFSALSGESEGKLKRALANYITQGDAINKFFLFNQVNEKLREIDPTLPTKYGILSASSLIFNYWGRKQAFSRRFVGSAVGSEEVIPTNDVYTIKVRGENFVLLIHELVKGINEYLALGISSQEEMDTEPLSDEMKQFLIGPGLDLKLRQMIPQEKIEYLPLIKKSIYQLPINQIQELFAGGGKSQVIMRNIIRQSEQIMRDYEQSQESPEGGENWR